MEARPHGPNLIAAIACFTLSAALAVASVLFVIVTMREYGPGEGFADVAGQSLPFAAAGLVVAVVLVWVGRRFLRAARQPEGR
jgi:membrane protein implicated in regulation of membrane protease activity